MSQHYFVFSVASQYAFTICLFFRLETEGQTLFFHHLYAFGNILLADSLFPLCGPKSHQCSAI